MLLVELNIYIFSDNHRMYVEKIKSVMNEGRSDIKTGDITTAKVTDDDVKSMTKSEEDMCPELELESTDDKGYDNESYVITAFASSTVEIPDENNAVVTPTENLVIKLAVESRVVIPTGWRITLRSVMMSLLISNSVLWIFTCLEGTAYNLNMYQAQYYGEMSWNVITLICLPLFILFRMHSAGCLFEIWSYA